MPTLKDVMLKAANGMELTEEEKGILKEHNAEAEAAEAQAKMEAGMKAAWEKFMRENPDRKNLDLGGDRKDAPKYRVNFVSDLLHAQFLMQKGAPLDDFQKELLKAQYRGITEGTTTSAGYLVNDDYRSEVLTAMKFGSTAMRDSLVIPCGTKLEVTPKVTASTSAYYVSEGSAGTESNITTDRISTSIKKLMTLHVVSEEAMADTFIDLQTLLQQEDAEAFAVATDLEFFTGAQGAFTGLTQSSDLTFATITGGVDGLDFAAGVEAINSIRPQYIAGAKAYMHPTVWAVIQGKYRTTTGEPFLYVSPTQSQPSQYHGFPVELCWSMPSYSTLGSSTPFLLIANLKSTTRIWQRQDIYMNVSNSAYVGSTSMFPTDQIAIKATMRHGLEITRPDYILAFRGGA